MSYDPLSAISDFAARVFRRYATRHGRAIAMAVADNTSWSYALAMAILEYAVAAEIYEWINRSKLHELKNDLILAAIRYAEIRVRSQRPAAAADPQIDADRTRAHNVFIDACNMLGACPSNRRVAIPARRDDFWPPSRSGDDGVPDPDGTPRSRAAEGGQKARRPTGGPEIPRLLCCRISQTHY